MPTPTEGGNANAADVLHLDRESEGMWAPGPNAHWKLLSDPAGKGKGFSRADLHRKLIAHHETIHGGDTHAVSGEFENAGRGHAQTVFHKKLPGEVKRYLEGNPAARHLFRVTNDPASAGGEDALHDLGDDKYFGHVDRLHGSAIHAALDTAHDSDDPEMRFMAAIHDHLPDGKGRKNIANVPAGKLKVGQRFTFGGIPMRVVEDSSGHKVVAGMGDDVPLDALKQVPVDRGSLKAARSRKPVADDVAPFSAAEPEDAWLLNPSALLLSTAVSSAPKQHLGQPVMELWGDALVCGNYEHPSTGQRFSFDHAKLDRAAASLSRMLADGNQIPIVEDHQEKAAKSLGWVVGAKREGDTLKLRHRFIGADAIQMAARNLVSVKYRPSFRDAKGRVYPDAITHSSLTPVPVIPHQQGFSIAASRGPAANPADNVSAPVYLLAAPSMERSTSMPTPAELLQRFKNLPGAPEATEDATAEHVLSLCLSYAETAGNALVTLRDENDVLLSRAEQAEASALELSRTASSLPDDSTLMLLSRAAESEWAGVRAAGYPKPLVDDLKALFRDNGKPNALSLSRDHGGADPLEFMVTGLLAKHKPAVDKLLGEVAPAQDGDLKLSRDKAKDDDEGTDVTAKMIAMANGKGKSPAGMAKMCKGD